MYLLAEVKNRKSCQALIRDSKVSKKIIALLMTFGKKSHLWTIFQSQTYFRNKTVIIISMLISSPNWDIVYNCSFLGDYYFLCLQAVLFMSGNFLYGTLIQQLIISYTASYTTTTTSCCGVVCFWMILGPAINPFTSERLVY